MQTTTNYGLKKPDAATDNIDINIINDNMDIMDTQVKANESAIATHSDESTKYSTYKSNKDSNGIYTTIQLKRSDGTLYVESVLSGCTSPAYTTRTETFYKVDGTTVDYTKVYTRTYDADGDLLSEVMN